MQRISYQLVLPLSEPTNQPRASRIFPQAIAELTAASLATKPAETDDGAALLFMHGGAWVRWAQMPASIPRQE
jgi:hypothetical protein